MSPRRGDPRTTYDYRTLPENRKAETWGECSHGRVAHEVHFKRKDGSWGLFNRSHGLGKSGMFALWEPCEGTFTPNPSPIARSSKREASRHE